MKLRAEIADIARLMADEVKAGEKAVHLGIRDAGIALKAAWRGQITGAGLGQRRGDGCGGAAAGAGSRTHTPAGQPGSGRDGLGGQLVEGGRVDTFDRGGEFGFHRCGFGAELR